MCYHISNNKKEYNLRKLEIEYNDLYQPIYHASGHTYPLLPVVTNEEPEHVQRLQWGLMPFWAKSDFNRNYTLNAKAETLFELRSFKQHAMNRCVLLVDGFFEWRHEGKLTYPFRIFLPGEQVFPMAAIYSNWTDKETGETKGTFAVITTDANEDMAYIHNTKKRMPVILDAEGERAWLDDDLTQSDMSDLMKPYQGELKYHTIQRLINQRGVYSNVPQVLEPFQYPELSKQSQEGLF
jgi:putative SOS response-associated peptidase YedK